MDIVKKIISKNFTKGRAGKIPLQICLHTAVTKADTLYHWFNGNAKSSTTFYVNKFGIIEQYVDELDTAWGNSKWSNNLISISIETWDNANPSDPVRTDAMYEGVSQLIAYLSKKYDIPVALLTEEEANTDTIKGIALHKYFAAKSCPGGLNVSRIIDRVKEILNINNNDMIDLSPIVLYRSTNTINANIRPNPNTSGDPIGQMPPLSLIKASKITKGELVKQNNRETNNWIYDSERKGWFSCAWTDVEKSSDCSTEKAEIEKLNDVIKQKEDKIKSLEVELDKYEPITYYRKK